MSDNVPMAKQKEPPDPDDPGTSTTTTTTPTPTPQKRSWGTEVKEQNDQLTDSTLEGREDAMRQLLQTPTKRPRSSPTNNTPNKTRKEDQEQELSFDEDETTTDNETENIEQFTSQETDDETQTGGLNIIDPPDSQMTTTIQETIQTIRAIQEAIQEDQTECRDQSSTDATEAATPDDNNTHNHSYENRDEEIRYKVNMADFPPPPTQQQQREKEKEDERFVGKNTVITNITNILKNFDKIALIKDLKKAIPAILPFIECVGRRDRSDLEIALKEDTPQALIHQLIIQGLNTHKTHLQFMPDTDDTKVTKVTLFGLPHELGDGPVNEEMRKYGNVVSSYRHKERIDDLTIFTGQRVYTMTIETPIPKLIQIAGHKVNTIYTDQKEHLEKQQAEQKQAERRKREEEQHYKREQHTVRIEKDGVKSKVCSFLHPDIQEEQPTLQAIKTLRETLNLTNEKKLLYVERHGKPPAREYQRSGRTFVRLPVDIHTVIAMAEADNGILDRLKPAHDTTLDHLRAVALYSQFGFCEEDTEYTFNKRCFTEGQIEIWQSWSRSAALGDPDFLPSASDNFFKEAVQDAVGGYYISIPKAYTYSL